jgi:hypothetical protein
MKRQLPGSGRKGTLKKYQQWQRMTLREDRAKAEIEILEAEIATRKARIKELRVILRNAAKREFHGDDI